MTNGLELALKTCTEVAGLYELNEGAVAFATSRVTAPDGRLDQAAEVFLLVETIHIAAAVHRRECDEIEREEGYRCLTCVMVAYALAVANGVVRAEADHVLTGLVPPDPASGGHLMHD